MDEPTRRAWSKPELIVLMRSGPEEAVLTGCKTAASSAAEAGANTACEENVFDLAIASGRVVLLGRRSRSPLDPLALGPRESVKEGGVRGLRRGRQRGVHSSGFVKGAGGDPAECLPLAP